MLTGSGLARAITTLEYGLIWLGPTVKSRHRRGTGFRAAP
jgi:hypothetical protein